MTANQTPYFNPDDSLLIGDPYDRLEQKMIGNSSLPASLELNRRGKITGFITALHDLRTGQLRLAEEVFPQPIEDGDAGALIAAVKLLGWLPLRIDFERKIMRIAAPANAEIFEAYDSI